MRTSRVAVAAQPSGVLRSFRSSPCPGSDPRMERLNAGGGSNLRKSDYLGGLCRTMVGG